MYKSERRKKEFEKIINSKKYKRIKKEAQIRIIEREAAAKKVYV